MKREEKAQVMKETAEDLNRAKDEMYEATLKLEAAGMVRDAERLMRMIYRLEAFQNKYQF